MKKIPLISLVLIVILGCNPSNREPNEKSVVQSALLSKESVKVLYDNIKNLEGHWEGVFEWTGKMTGSGNIQAKYSINGRESAVIESLLDGDRITMSSVYHLDGPSTLRMTHFCSANQPRLKAVSLADNHRSVAFDIVDVTNYTPNDHGHVDGVELKFVDEDHLIITFNYRHSSGERSKEVIQLSRIIKPQIADL